ncbi:MFS domain-containing protein [Fusarium sp. Ph1]|nr:MFS domain-containing protein [Fusarium sp. Ph1]
MASPATDQKNPTNAAHQLEEEFVEHAQDTHDVDRDLKFLDAIKAYPKAVGWSVLLSTAIVMEGYDLKLIPQMFAQPAFTRSYGRQLEDGKYEISAQWQAGLSNGAIVGSLFGLLFGGWVVERVGFRKTMLGALSAVTGLIFLQFFAQNLEMLQAAQILIGLPMGIFQSITTHYAVEITPTCLRAYLTTYVNLCWVLGQMCSSGVMRGFVQRSDQWAFRIPFAIQWMWPLLLVVGIFFAPESPWWLVRHGKIDEAKAVLHQLQSRKRTDFDVDNRIALMIATTQHEHEVNTGTTYAACFRGTNCRRTIIAMGCSLAQGLCGAGFRNYSTYFYLQAGLPAVQAFNMTIVQYALAVIGAFAAWFLLPFLGRRQLYIWGLVSIVLCHTATGGIGIAYHKRQSTGLAWASGSMLLLFTLIYDITIGPVAYALVSEIPSVLLRGKTIVIARMSYVMFSIVSNTITPYMLNPSQWDWGARAGFFWAGTALVMLTFAYFMIPETKDRTFYELDKLFEQGVSARQFSKTEVEPLDAVPVAKNDNFDA